MTNLGRKPKRIDITTTKGLRWRVPLSVTENGVLRDISADTFVCKIRKTYSDAVSYSCTFPAGDTDYLRWWELPGAISEDIPIGNSPDDPASKYVYDVMWYKEGEADGENIINGIWSFIPGSSNV